MANQLGQAVVRFFIGKAFAPIDLSQFNNGAGAGAAASKPLSAAEKAEIEAREARMERDLAAADAAAKAAKAAKSTDGAVEAKSSSASRNEVLESSGSAGASVGVKKTGTGGSKKVD